LSDFQTAVGIALALCSEYCLSTAILGGNAPHTRQSIQNDFEPLKEERDMRKLIVALMISAAFIVSGVSGTTFSSGQITPSAWAEGGD